jgi:hypothetical protein
MHYRYARRRLLTACSIHMSTLSGPQCTLNIFITSSSHDFYQCVKAIYFTHSLAHLKLLQARQTLLDDYVNKLQHVRITFRLLTDGDADGCGTVRNLS